MKQVAVLIIGAGPVGLVAGLRLARAGIETLVLDPARRLVLVECDGESRLLMLGEGRELNPPGRKPEA